MTGKEELARAICKEMGWYIYHSGAGCLYEIWWGDYRTKKVSEGQNLYDAVFTAIKEAFTRRPRPSWPPINHES